MHQIVQCESCLRVPAVYAVAFGHGYELRTAPRFLVCASCLDLVRPVEHDWVEIIKLSA